MPFPDAYRNGTVTVTNGSAIVNATGTLFVAEGFEPGDYFERNGLTFSIANINSNTQLTLVKPWTGPTGTGAYEIRYLPDTARLLANTRAAITMFEGFSTLPDDIDAAEFRLQGQINAQANDLTLLDGSVDTRFAVVDTRIDGVEDRIDDIVIDTGSDGLRASNALLLQQHKRRMQLGEPVRISCFGDSLTQGVGTEPGEPGYPGVLQTLLRDYYQNPSITLDNQGIGGDNTNDLLARFSAMEAFDPDIVCLMIGMNDAVPTTTAAMATYRNNLLILIQQLREVGCAILMADITPRKRVNNDAWKWVDAYRCICQEIAAAQGIQMVPMFDALTDIVASENGYSWADLSNDGIHYNSVPGYRQIAGVWLAYGLALEPLALRCGQERDMIGSHVVAVAGASLIYDDTSSTAKETAMLRYTAGVSGTNMRIYLWVENYQHSDLVLYMTRERHATLLPSILVSNLDIDDDSARTFSLGQINSSVGRALSVPLRVCRLGPGLNIINLRCNSGCTAEFAKMAVQPVDALNVTAKGFLRERFSRQSQLYSSSAPNPAPLDSGSSPQNVTPGGPKSVRAGQRVFLGNLDTTPQLFASRYRLRGRITDGLILEVYGSSRPGFEELPIAEFVFAASGTNGWTITARSRLATGPVIWGTFTFPVTNINDDVKLQLLLERSATRLSFGNNTTNIFSVPFAISMAALLAYNSGSANSMVFNPLVKLSDTANLTFEDSGESWINFHAQTRVTVIGGSVLSASLGA